LVGSYTQPAYESTAITFRASAGSSCSNASIAVVTKAAVIKAAAISGWLEWHPFSSIDKTMAISNAAGDEGSFRQLAPDKFMRAHYQERHHHMRMR
jgi:hypothetical protein